jgi:cob(I)alamin adenosyltransferase
MSITTQRGDTGETDLMFGRRVAKTHPSVAAYGEVDELNAALGLARVFSTRPAVTTALAARQDELIGLMGELATAPEDRPRYAAAGYRQIDDATVDALTAATAALESDLNTRFHGWATPGANTTPCGAALDLARTVCRRAERAVLASREPNPTLTRHLNRLSDFLWLLARSESLTLPQDETPSLPKNPSPA